MAAEPAPSTLEYVAGDFVSTLYPKETYDACLKHVMRAPTSWKIRVREWMNLVGLDSKSTVREVEAHAGKAADAKDTFPLSERNERIMEMRINIAPQITTADGRRAVRNAVCSDLYFLHDLFANSPRAALYFKKNIKKGPVDRIDEYLREIPFVSVDKDPVFRQLEQPQLIELPTIGVLPRSLETTVREVARRQYRKDALACGAAAVDQLTQLRRAQDFWSNSAKWMLDEKELVKKTKLLELSLAVPNDTSELSAITLPPHKHEVWALDTSVYNLSVVLHGAATAGKFESDAAARALAVQIEAHANDYSIHAARSLEMLNHEITQLHASRNRDVLLSRRVEVNEYISKSVSTIECALAAAPDEFMVKKVKTELEGTLVQLQTTALGRLREATREVMSTGASTDAKSPPNVMKTWDTVLRAHVVRCQSMFLLLRCTQVRDAMKDGTPMPSLTFKVVDASAELEKSLVQPARALWRELNDRPVEDPVATVRFSALALDWNQTIAAFGKIVDAMEGRCRKTIEQLRSYWQSESAAGAMLDRLRQSMANVQRFPFRSLKSLPNSILRSYVELCAYVRPPNDLSRKSVAEVVCQMESIIKA